LESNSYPLEKQGAKLSPTLLKELDHTSPCVGAQKAIQNESCLNRLDSGPLQGSSHLNKPAQAYSRCT